MAEEEETRFWVYAGGLPFELTEGDLICVFSQFGEITEMTLSRDRETGKSRGFGFIKYEDPRSCEMAVDNFNGATVVGRKLKVSFANNLRAVKDRRPAAPQEGSMLPIVEPPKRRYSNSPSPRNRYSRSPVRNNRDDYDRNRSSNYDRVERRRGSPDERYNYRDQDTHQNRRDNEPRYRDRDQSRGGGRYKDSSSYHRRRDSRERGDDIRSRHRRDDNNSDRSYHRHRSPEHLSRRDYGRSYRRSRSRSRSGTRSPPRQRSPDMRHYYHEGGDRRDHYQRHSPPRRHRDRDTRTRHDSRER